VAIILVWLSIIAGAITLVQVIYSLRKVATQSGGAGRRILATVLFSVITSALTIISLFTSLQQLGLL
jgi:hypothetical protein